MTDFYHTFSMSRLSETLSSRGFVVPTLHGNRVATERARPCFRAVWGCWDSASSRLVKNQSNIAKSDK